MTEKYQDEFLKECSENEIPVTVFLISGYQMVGTITGFDNFSVVLNNEGQNKLIYKHAISTVQPQESIDL